MNFFLFLIFIFFILIIIFYYINKIIKIKKFYKKCHKPIYDEELWKKDSESNNCYAYAMRDIDKKFKPSPGNFSNRNNNDEALTKCEDIYSFIKSDYPDRQIYFPEDETNEQQCKKCNYYKIGLYIDNEEKDYHFYRQNKDGYWSHKPGSNEVTNLDADNNLIRDPDKASRKYTELNYSKVCKKMCVPYVYSDSLD
jgi:hypothetical protein